MPGIATIRCHELLTVTCLVYTELKHETQLQQRQRAMRERPFNVIRCCANRRGIYDSLSALCSNLTSIFNRYWDITVSLHILVTHYLCFICFYVWFLCIVLCLFTF